MSLLSFRFLIFPWYTLLSEAKKLSNIPFSYRNLTSLKGTAPIRLRPSVVLGSDGIRGVQQTLFEIITRLSNYDEV